MGCETESIRLDEVQKAIGVEETKNILFALASDEMKGRDSKHGGYAKAAAFTADYFQKNNIQPFYPAYRDSLMTDSLWSYNICLLYTSPSPRDLSTSRMPSSA